jgi:hypothetical protein
MYPRVLFRISRIFEPWNCLEGSGPRDGTTTMVLLEPLHIHAKLALSDTVTNRFGKIQETVSREAYETPTLLTGLDITLDI